MTSYFNPRYCTHFANHDAEESEDKKTDNRRKKARSNFIAGIRDLMARNSVSASFVRRFWERKALSHNIAHIGYLTSKRKFELGIGINPAGEPFDAPTINGVAAARKIKPLLGDNGLYKDMEIGSWLRVYVPRQWDITSATRLIYVDVSRPDDDGGGTGIIIAVFHPNQFARLLSEWDEKIVDNNKHTIDSSSLDDDDDDDDDAPPPRARPLAESAEDDDEGDDDDDGDDHRTRGGKSLPGVAHKSPPPPPPPPPRPTTGGKTFRGAQARMPTPSTASKSPRDAPPPQSLKRREPDSMPEPAPPAKAARLTISTDVPRDRPIVLLAQNVERLLWERPDDMDETCDDDGNGIAQKLQDICIHLTFYDYAVAVKRMNQAMKRNIDILCGMCSSSSSSSDGEDGEDLADYFPRIMTDTERAEQDTTYIKQWLSDHAAEIARVRLLMHRLLCFTLNAAFKQTEDLPSARAVAAVVRQEMRAIFSTAQRRALCATCYAERSIPGNDKCVNCTLSY